MQRCPRLVRLSPTLGQQSREPRGASCFDRCATSIQDPALWVIDVFQDLACQFIVVAQVRVEGHAQELGSGRLGRRFWPSSESS